MSRHKRFIEDVERRQENTVWPKQLPNSTKADGFMWFGSDAPTLVQRIGCGLFGAVFLCQSAFFMLFAWKQNDAFAIGMLFVVASFFLIIGARIFWNAIRPTKRHRNSN
jgi:hypothetical protein